MKGGELAEQLDEGAFAEGVGDGGVESEGGVGFREVADPGRLDESCISDASNGCKVIGWTLGRLIQDMCEADTKKVPICLPKVVETFNSKRNIPGSLMTSPPRRRTVHSRHQGQELRIRGQFTKVVTDGSSIEEQWKCRSES